jgi:hypothetical protein
MPIIRSSEDEGMRAICSVAVATLLLGGVIGCRSAQLAYDQDHIRTAVMELETNQIMDNLIRCRKGLPFLHLDYVHMTGTVTDTANGSLGGSQTGVSSRSLQGPTTALTFLHSFTNVLNWNAAGTKVNQLTLTAEPVTSAPEVYSAYLAFLKNPAHLMETPEPPTPDQALITSARAVCGGSSCSHWKHHQVVYYWVPCEFRDEFRRLSLYTVALRGQPIMSSPNFDVTVLGFNPADLPKATGEAGDLPQAIDDKAHVLRFKMDKKLPNNNGYMIATIKGKMYNSPLYIPGVLKIYQNDDLAEAIPGQADNSMTDWLRLEIIPSKLKIAKIDDVIAGLTNQKVQIHLDYFVPGGSPTDRALEDIRYQLELNRLNQFPVSFP